MCERNSYTARMSWVTLARTVFLLCLASAAEFSAGCGSKAPQYPEEHARYVRLDQSVESLRGAYVRKDLSAMEALMLPSESVDRLIMDIKKDFEQYADISLDFSIERVIIEGDQIDVFLHWQGQWKKSASESGMRDRGHGLLRWSGTQSPLLNGVSGDLPFGMAVRHTVPRAQPNTSS